MQEEAYNRVRADDFGSFTFTSKRSLEAFLRRADEYDIETDVNRYYMDGDFDTATVKVPAGSLRPLRYLLSTA
jgi:hypothetical protein